MLANELIRRDEAAIRSGLLRIWSVMQECVEAGCRADGVLPGGLKVRRRAGPLLEKLEQTSDPADPLYAMEWVTLYALAVNEQNAAGGRVVTAPTNGAAGIVPAVLHYYTRFVPGAGEDGVIAFLLTAAAVGVLFKENASISGAEVGCQGEVGSACSMAAAGLAEVLGGTPEQVENAAEIGLEHNLGRVLDLLGSAAQHLGQSRGGHRARRADLALAADLGAGDRRVLLEQHADRCRGQQERDHSVLAGTGH